MLFFFWKLYKIIDMAEKQFRSKSNRKFKETFFLKDPREGFIPPRRYKTGYSRKMEQLWYKIVLQICEIYLLVYGISTSVFM